MKNRVGTTDGIRMILCALVCIVLFCTIIGIPVALFLMQMERLIQLNQEGD
jgi:uncharacterized membrane protein YccF (DUF307 family)